MSKLRSAVSFRTAPVTLVVVLTYLVLVPILIWIHQIPPPVAREGELKAWGIDFDDAWKDLQEVTREFRPYNSRRNDEVRVYLWRRIQDILKENIDAGFDGEVETFDDNDTNVISARKGGGGLTVYFEGTNLMVYIHGTREDLSPVLINAHYDSVSTGYGATDDGKATVSVLQVIKAFTSPQFSGERRIKRGIVALLNNGEEDYLNGARAYAVHPIANLSHTFLNLEGAGAGGRATLFRTTDTEVTKFYKNARRPFGTVISGDGFKRGLIRSQTDFVVFVDDLGMRGLDVAYSQGRSKYHTEDDDVKHTSKRSLWHMLGTALQTLDAATSDVSGEFDQNGEKPAGTGTDAVWYDLFGRVFVVFRLHTLFALTITLVVVPFVVMSLTAYGLYATGKFYYLSNTPLVPQPPEDSDQPKTTRGWRGFFRFPVAFGVASGSVIGFAFLLNKINPLIAYSSEYSVWVMFLSLWWCLVWFVLRGADAVRPSALGRGYAFIELWCLWLVILVSVAVSEDRAHLASGYPVLVIYAGIFLSAWLSLLELAGLPKKPSPEAQRRTSRSNDYGSDGHSQLAASDGQVDDDEGAATEETPLFRSSNPTFNRYSRRAENIITVSHEYDDEEPTDPPEDDEDVYGKEQAWSKHLPSYVWILQFLLSVPVPLMFTVPIGLLLGTAVSQTGADGSSMLTVYLLLGTMSIIILLPASPFFHRVSYQLTTLIFIFFLGTSIYNLTAFPFSHNARLKVFFQQSINIHNSTSESSLVGHPSYIRDLVANNIPSASGQPLSTTPDPLRLGLTRVSWRSSPPPNVVPGLPPSSWMSYNLTTSSSTPGELAFSISAIESRACKIIFSHPVTDITVPNSKPLGSGKPSKEIRLWSREWGRGWSVTVKYDEQQQRGLKGQVRCLWSDANGDLNLKIPGLREVKRFLPEWAVVSKLGDGLVEAWGEWEV